MMRTSAPSTSVASATMPPAIRRYVPAPLWKHRLGLADLVIGFMALVGAAVRVLGAPPNVDDVTYATPAQQITLAAWSRGELALWSSDAFGGTAHLGNMQTAAWYPLHLVAAPFPDLLGSRVYLTVHLVVFAAGLYALGRVMGLRRPAPIALALIGLWMGTTVARGVLTVHLPPLAWTPAALAAVWWLATTARPVRAAATLGVLLWCVVVSGHPQSVLMAVSLITVWSVGVAAEHRAWRRTPYAVGAAGAAAAMAAPLLLAVADATRGAAHTTRDLSALLPAEYNIPPRVLPLWLLGRPFESVAAIFTQGSERVYYVGATTAALAIIGLGVALRTRRWSLVAVAAFGALAATWSVGPRSPTLRVARALIPGFDQPRVSSRWVWVVAMAMLLLAAAGIDRLRRGRSPRGAAAIAAVGCAAMVGTLTVFPREHVAALPWLAAGVAVAAGAWAATTRGRWVAASAIALVLVVELAVPLAGHSSNPWRNTSSTDAFDGPAQDVLAGQPGLTVAITNDNFVPPYLVEGMRPNANTLRHIRSIDGYDAGVGISRRWHAALRQVIATISDMPFRGQIPGVVDAETFARLGVRFVLYDPDRGPGEATFPGWQLVFSGRFEVWENPLWLGDTVAWYNTLAVDTPEDAGDLLRADDGPLDHTGLVEDAAVSLRCADCPPDHFISTTDGDGHRRVTVDVPRDALVAIHEKYDLGWQVTVDGVAVEPTPVDGVWLGVPVPAGRHEVEVRYAPGWVAAAVTVAVGAGVATVAVWWRGDAWAAAVVRGRRRRRAEPSDRPRRWPRSRPDAPRPR